MPFSEIIETLQEKEQELRKLATEYREKADKCREAIQGVRMMQGEEEKKKGNLAVQKGICPFPEACNKRYWCTKDRCNHDQCDNGHSFRGS